MKTRVDGITVLSTRNVEFGGVHEPAGERIKTSEGRLWLLFLPLGGSPDAKQTLTDALEEAEADYLRNVHLVSGGWSILALSYGWITVEGDPWRSRSGGGSPAP